MHTQTPEGLHKGGGSNTPTANFLFMKGDLLLMDANKIEKFIDAGYTKQEIELLFKDPKVDPEPNQEPEPEPDPKQEPEAELKDNDTMAEAIKSLTNTVNALSDTVKAMQTANINSDKTDSNKDKTIEGVMQSFIEKL